MFADGLVLSRERRYVSSNALKLYISWESFQLETMEAYAELRDLNVPVHWLPIVSSLESALIFNKRVPTPPYDGSRWYQLRLLRHSVTTLREELSALVRTKDTEQDQYWHDVGIDIEGDHLFTGNWQHVFHPTFHALRYESDVSELLSQHPLGAALYRISGTRCPFEFGGCMSRSQKRKRSDSGSTDNPVAVSSDEGEREEEIVSSGEPMPSALHTYYHTVVYFSNKRSSSRRHNERVDLAELSESLKKYVVNKRKDFTKNFILADHFYTCDFDVVRNSKHATTIINGDVAFPSAQEPTEFIEPHVHIVWYRTSNNRQYGVEGHVAKWADKFGARAHVSSTEVKCFHCIRQYLRKGAGRVVRIEVVSDPLEQRLCHGRTEGDVADGSDDVPCKDHRNELCGDVESKLKCWQCTIVLLKRKRKAIARISTYRR